MSEILIVGAAGFLGKALVRKLAVAHQITTYTRNDAQKISLEQLFVQHHYHAVINCAVSYSNDLLLSAYTNLQLPISLLHLCTTHNVPQFLGFDSFYSKARGAYDHLPAYQLCKRQLLEWYSLAGKTLAISSLQIEQMYGPGDNLQKSIMSLLKAMKENVASLDLTDGTQERDFIYVDDVAHAVQLLIDQSSLLTKGVKYIEVGTGSARSLKSFLEEAKKIAKSTTTLNFGVRPHREGEIMRSKADTTFLKSVGWQATTSLEEGLKSLFKSIA